MERIHQNHVEGSPATTSWVYPYEDSDYHMLQNEPLNHIGPVQYGARGAYGPMPAFLRPRGYMTSAYQSYDAVNAANFLPYGSQVPYVHPPMFYRNPIRFQHGMPVVNNFYYRGRPAARNFRGQLIHRPELFDGSSLRFGSGDNIYAGNQSDVHRKRIYSHNEGHPSTESRLFHSPPANTNFSVSGQDMEYGYSHPIYMKSWDWTHGNERVIQGIHHGANLSQSNNFPMGHGRMQQNFPQPDDSISSKGATRYINEDCYRGHGVSVVAEEPTGLDQEVLPVEKTSGSCKMDLLYSDDKNRVGTSPTESLVVSSTLKSLESSSSAKQLGKRCKKTRSKKSTQPTRDPAPHLETGNRKAPAPRYVLRKKIKVQLPAIRSKQSKECTTPTDHITWDGFDEESEQVGQNCALCEEDLSYAPADYDAYEYYDYLDEPPNPPEVAVLSCGHVFHSKCLEFNTPEEQSSDPPCILCFSLYC